MKKPEPWPDGVPYPAVMTPRELMRVLGYGDSQFFVLQKRGAFRMFEVSRPIGLKRYSGELVRRFKDGESVTRFGAGARRAG